MRSGESRRYNDTTGKFAPGFVHVRCCYLFIYWPGNSQDTKHDKPDSESSRAMNRVLNAVLSRRTFANLPGSYTRVIPPQEQLNSLGNFWQSMDNKPKLCLSYSVTVPVQLKGGEQINPPKDRIVVLDNQDAGDALELVSVALWQRLCNALCEKDAANRATIL